MCDSFSDRSLQPSGRWSVPFPPARPSATPHRPNAPAPEFPPTPKPRHATRHGAFAALLLLAAPLAADSSRLGIFAEEDPQTPETWRLVWATVPGHRYEVQESADLQVWSVVPGFPAVADGPAQQMPLSLTGQARYFRVRELDEQPPVIVSQYPKPDAFAVPRLAGLTVELDDATGVDPASLRLTVEPLGTFTLADPQLTFTNRVLRLTPASNQPLGAFGTKVTASLIAADVLGNRGTNTWSFDLEVEPKVVTNLFVFGSGRAQRSGQKVAHLPTAALAERAGPVPASPGDSWTLEEVAADRLVLAYTGEAPAFVVGTYLSNLTPRRLEEIFYRQVTSVRDDPANRRLTLFTRDVPLAELIERGSLSLAGNAPVYEVTDDGTIIKPARVARMGEWELAHLELGGDWSGKKVFEKNGVALTTDVAYIGLTNTLTVALETEWFSLRRFDITLKGDFGAGLKPRLTVNWAGQDDREVPLGKPLRKLIFIGSLGPVPVWLDANFTVTAGMKYDWSVFGEFTAGVTATAGLELGANYVKDRSPSVQWKSQPRPPEVTLDPFQYEINGAASATVKLVPKLDLRVNSLAGLWVNVDPRLEVSGQARLVNHQLESAHWQMDALADLNARLSVIGIADDKLPRLEPVPLLAPGVWRLRVVYPEETATVITIHRPPQSLTVTEGQSALFSVDATANRPMTFQWYHRGVPVFNRPARLGDPRLLVLNPVALGDAGEYRVRIWAGDQVVDSAPATLTVLPRAPRAVPGMVWIPPGTFTMGSPPSERDRYSDEGPQTLVTISRGFFLGKYEVTQREYLAVMGSNPSWFTGDLDRPVEQVTWYEAVEYCNRLTARERAAGRLPAGYEYRLPTEAQWEYACRAGTTTATAFGDSLSSTQANFNGNYPYNGGARGPYLGRTTKVGSYSPNAWGLYDMHGNVWEWCADWYSGSYPGGRVTDPQGPTWGSDRVYRGGSWVVNGRLCRSANRVRLHPSNWLNSLGFRVALVPVP